MFPVPAYVPPGLINPELVSPLFGCGGLKLEWLKISKISARNWTLKDSEIRVIGKTL